MEIESLQNRKVKLWRSLNTRAGREESGLFLAEGDHLTGEALHAGRAEALLIDTDRESQYASYLRSAGDIAVYRLSSRILDSICDAKTPQGVAAVCRIQNASVSGSRLIALEGVQDPGNVGSILRTMDAAAFSGMLIDENTADPYGPKALRASMGAIFRVPVCRVKRLSDSLKGLRGYSIYAGDLRGEPIGTVADEPGGICLLFGNEGAGLTAETLACATHRVRLPMPGGAESLGVAAAAAIMIYRFVRENEL